LRTKKTAQVIVHIITVVTIFVISLLRTIKTAQPIVQVQFPKPDAVTVFATQEMARIAAPAQKIATES